MNKDERNREKQRKEGRKKNMQKNTKTKPEGKRQKLSGRPAGCPPFTLSGLFLLRGVQKNR